jgi:sensor c-di-GMP phosphodiesterase-like protein
MRNAMLSKLVPISLFIFGVFIINLQLWYSARLNSADGARHAAANINAILDEARNATTTALRVAADGCTGEGAYALGTEAALNPHLRTILIFKDGDIWCSSLPGNRVLINEPESIPDDTLKLLPAKDTVNDRPILIYQNAIQHGRVMVTISDSHVREALSTSIHDAGYTLVVGQQMISRSGDVQPVGKNQSTNGIFTSKTYPFSIDWQLPSFFSLGRMWRQGAGLLFFMLVLSVMAAYVAKRYLNKTTTPEDNLRKAIANGEIVPFYQPVVNGQTGAIYGVEVLARWKHPKVGFISPVSFIPIAEKSGLIVPLTQSLMNQVAAQMKPIFSKLSDGFHIGINLSASHMNAPSFMDDCLRYQQEFAGANIKLVLEVTEREPLFINKQLVENLNRLHEKGFAIALDDFGTGYSGLSYLNDLSIDYIKIDKSFVGRVNGTEESSKLIDCVIEMARKLSLHIIAEGVETKEQLDYLNRNHITLLQGYYFFKPVTYINLIKILLSKNKEAVIVE